MSKTLKFLSLVFAISLLCSVAVASVSTPNPPVLTDQVQNALPNQNSLPDADTNWLGAIVSGLGGFGGAGILLIFLIRRFVTTYDETNKRWDEKFEKMTVTFNVMVDEMWDKWETKYEKLTEKYDMHVDSWGEKIDGRMERITESLDGTKETINGISVELATLKETAVTKDICFRSGRELERMKEKIDTIERAIKL